VVEAQDSPALLGRRPTTFFDAMEAPQYLPEGQKVSPRPGLNHPSPAT
jgi:hypothetical protein